MVVVLVCNVPVLAGVGAGDTSHWGRRLCWDHERGAGRALAVRWRVLDSGVMDPYFSKVRVVSWKRYRL